MAVDMGALTADLAAESAELYEVLSVLAEPEWVGDMIRAALLQRRAEGQDVVSEEGGAERSVSVW